MTETAQEAAREAGQLVYQQMLPVLVKRDRSYARTIWNAIKHGDSGTAIDMGCRPSERGCYEFHVGNRGKVIPPDQQESLFSGFVVGRKGRESVRVPSTGLGLTFCKLAVEAHGGTIRVVSPWAAYGGGVMVLFTLPGGKSTNTGTRWSRSSPSSTCGMATV